MACHGRSDACLAVRRFSSLWRRVRVCSCSPISRADCFGPLCRPSAEELLFRDGMALDEQSVFQSSVVPDGLQSNVHAVDLGFGVRQTGGSRAAAVRTQAGSSSRPSGSLISTQPRRSSARSSASPPVRHGHDAELFHFYNGHISPPLSFRQ